MLFNKPIMLQQLFSRILPVVITAAAIVGCKKDYDPGVVAPPSGGGGQAAIDWNKAADSSTNNLVDKFWNASGNYFNESNVSTNFHYWPQAHGLDVLVDAYERTGNQVYKGYMD